MRWFKAWMEEETWIAARRLTRTLRLQRTEMRILMLCRFTAEGPHTLDRLPIHEILAIRQIVGKNWFDMQLLLCDEGNEVADPFRSIVRAAVNFPELQDEINLLRTEKRESVNRPFDRYRVVK